MASVKSLKKSRATIKGQLTTLLNYVNNVPERDDIDEFNTRLKRAHELLKQFTSVEEKLFIADDTEESDCVEVDEKYYRIVAKLNRLIREDALNHDHNASMSTSVNQSASNFTGSLEVKLPDIRIAPFSGEDKTKWQPFFQLFTSAVHNVQKLTATRKFFYLKSFLTGDAAGLVEHLSLTDGNYIEALNLLKSRYDRKKHIINDYIRNFLDQPQIHSANSVNLRKLLNTSEQVTRGLAALGTSAEARDHWLIYFLVKKLDDESKNLWAQSSADKDPLTLPMFFAFLLNRCDALESLDSSSKLHKSSSSSNKQSSTKSFLTSTASSCSYCNKPNHQHFECPSFKACTLEERKIFMKSESRCYNCLNKNHSVYNCKSRARCHKCHRKHHTLLHDPNFAESQSSVSSSTPQSSVDSSLSKPSSSSTVALITATEEVKSSAYYCDNQLINAILPTAVIKVQNKFGEYVKGRALLDSCSISSFITESFAHSLHLPRKNARVSISGLGQNDVGLSKGCVELRVFGNNCSDPFYVNALIIPRVTSRVPSSFVDRTSWNHLDGLNLADPQFNIPGDVDLLIGVQHFFNLLRDGIRHGQNNQPSAQNTQFGWIVGGLYANQDHSSTTLLTINPEIRADENTEANIDRILRAFWEVEEVPQCSLLTSDEQRCEDLYAETTKVTDSGRFIVRLPFKDNEKALGDSKYLAVRRLMALERRFARDFKFCDMYKSFMAEYEALGHMTEVPPTQIESCRYFLPHHGVLKESSSTTKLRVVFDGSAKSSNGKSVNDLLLVGPTVQSSLYDILLRFRLHQYVFTADVEKMYRQVEIADVDKPYQCIAWRKNSTEPVKYYQLNTITYGMSPAPFLATRSTNEVSNLNRAKFPAASSSIQNDMYVDDLMTGADNLEQAITLQQQINQIMSAHGFPLRKWIANSSEIILEDASSNPKEISEHSSESVKVLGIHWNSKGDFFSFKVNLPSCGVATKRTVASEAGKLFDPIGWLAPFIVQIKVLFQRLWLLKLSWDDPLPKVERKLWERFRFDLPNIEQCTIQRWLRTSNTSFELHGFCDASENAYAAAVYSRVFINGKYIVTLIAAKTKVSPIKQISIPRLELCGAVLLVKLVKSIVSAFNCQSSTLALWTDSKIVLDWLSSNPQRWTTFIANRTSAILDNYGRKHWNHVLSGDNPADCASRGLSASELKSFNLWWQGPTWLKSIEDDWPQQLSAYGTCEESKQISIVLLTIPQASIITEILAKYSSFDKMARILALVQRFIDRARVKNHRKKIVKLRCTYITRIDLDVAEIKIIKHEQGRIFNEDYRERDSCLRALNVFHDTHEILRVGGRIDNSTAQFEVKHPVIIPYQSHIATSIIRDYHLQNKHAGFTLVSSLIKQRFWIIRAKVLIRNTLRKCIPCFRQNPSVENQIMGNLPLARIEFNRPFEKVAVDYAGPIQAYFKRGRGQRPHKTYICVFVCMATKAIHIEVAFDLSTESFLAAFRRFTSRRGLCSDIFSDNGTNFVGANNHIKQLFQFLQDNNLLISHSLLKDKITWHFNPPTGSHFGGLFETAVKSTKLHLHRVTGGSILNYEELMTLLTEIEAILNSRPICLQSAETLDPLTPFHFLLGHARASLPSLNLQDVNVSRLSHWQQIERMRQHFWNRWHQEYLTSLHKRTKWLEKRDNLQIDDVVLIKDENLPPATWMMGRVLEVHPGKDVVLIKDENLPPATWKMGRVLEVHPGKDGQTRVVTLKTKTGSCRRPIHKLCRLPIN